MIGNYSSDVGPAFLSKYLSREIAFRPIITKDLNARLEDLYLRDKNFYENHHIDFKLKKEVVGVNVNKKIVLCSDGDIFEYDKLLIASGL